MALGPSEAELIGRVALAGVCGGLIGFERELSEKPAGLRTHALVALGAAAFTVAGFAGVGLPDAASFRPDVARIAAQVASGIGFLGAGIIIFHGDRLRGLTTAAELWSVAAIGVLSGLGYLLVAAVTTAFILLVLVGGRPLETAVDRMRIRRQRKRGLAAPMEEVEAPMAAEATSVVDDNGGGGTLPNV